MATKRLIGYYVVRNKSTGFYFRGKGDNRWGEYYNQASIYRIRAHAENTANWLNLRGEPVEIVPIKIVENPTVDATEVVHSFWDDSGRYVFPSGRKAICCDICKCALSVGEYNRFKWNYCPVCGAKMDGGATADEKR